jgi:hypothetical protein
VRPSVLLARFRRGGLVLATVRLAALLYLVFVVVVMLVDPGLRAVGSSPLPAWLTIPDLIATILTIAISGFAISTVLRRSLTGHKTHADALTAGLAKLAVWLAGQRRAYVREAWDSDLDRPRDPADGPGLSTSRKVAYAAGLVKAAVRYRADDAMDLWWRLADGVLASRLWSRLVLAGPCATAVVAIVRAEGLYGLVTNAGNLAAIGTASAGLVYGGRKVRKLTPKPVRQKQDQT